MKRAVRIVILVILALAVVANGALAAGIVLTREPAPRPLTAQRIATASKPAIVFIQSEYAITSSLPQSIITDATWNALYDHLLATRYYSSATQLEHDAEQAIMNSPDQYLSRGNTVTDTWSEWATGSGFFVTEDGYLVTAAHVVTASKEDVRAGILTYIKDPAFVTDHANAIKKSWADFSPTDAQVNNLVAFDQRWFQQYLSVDKIDAKFYLGTGASVMAGDNITATGIRASVVTVDPTVGGHDIAIMKADVSGVPALSIAAADPQLNEATYAIGYPRTAYLQETVPANQAVPIAVTQGSIQHMNSRTTSAGGDWKVYGTDAQFTHGDSGGPVVDAHGDVIGVISYIVPDANGNQLPGQGYFIPPSYIKANLAKASVTIAPDPKKTNLTNTYYRALAKGDSGRYKEELNLLLSIQDRSFKDAYVGADIIHVQSEIAVGNDKTPPDLALYVLPAAGSAAGVILLSLVSWLALAILVGRKPRVTVAPAPEPEPSLPAPPPPAEPTPGTPIPAD